MIIYCCNVHAFVMTNTKYIDLLPTGIRTANLQRRSRAPWTSDPLDPWLSRLRTHLPLLALHMSVLFPHNNWRVHAIEILSERECICCNSIENGLQRACFPLPVDWKRGLIWSLPFRHPSLMHHPYIPLTRAGWPTAEHSAAMPG